jgi:hypothetical protein
MAPGEKGQDLGLRMGGSLSVCTAVTLATLPPLYVLVAQEKETNEQAANKQT